jgi:hypothetical protein
LAAALSYDFLALLPFGVILSTPDEYLVHANPLARHLLARHQPLGVGPDGRLMATPSRRPRAGWAPSPNTVKSQLQRVFEKLQVSRPKELVRLLMDPVGNL